MKFEQLLARNVRGFWATSYSFGLKLFDQYLLRKLSQNTLNAVVLADHDKLADVWEHLPANERYLARRVGSRYLLRGIRLADGGAFHAKTYLFVRADDATLVVGSGNLTRDGIDGGREVFTSFSTARDADLPSLRDLGRLDVAPGPGRTTTNCSASAGTRYATPARGCSATPRIGAARQRRAGAARAAHRPHAGPDPRTARDRAVLRPQRARARRAHPGAQSRSCAAVRRRRDEGRRASLASVLTRAASGAALSYEPRTFVHAKLIGAIGSDGLGTLLMGSPNLSQAALTLTQRRAARQQRNRRHPRWQRGPGPRRLRGQRPRARRRGPLTASTRWSSRTTTRPRARPLVLRNATWRKDGRVELKWSGTAPRGRHVCLGRARCRASRIDEAA